MKLSESKTEEKELKNLTWIQVGKCERCEGVLIAEGSILRGMGPTCYHKTRYGTVYERLEAQGQMQMFPEKRA